MTSAPPKREHASRETFRRHRSVATKTYLTHANIVLADRVVEDGTLLIEDDRIAAICPDIAPPASTVDLGGHWLLPGIVDVHCDALEKELEPRPNVLFPAGFAIANADKRNAACGITTVYHALSFAHDELGVRNVFTAAELARAVHAYQPHGLVDNRTHLRYEITDPAGAPVLAALLEQGDAELLSFMDHSPGQGQFKTLEAYRDYVVRTYQRTPAEADAMARTKLAARNDARERVEGLARLAVERGVCLASHDDDSAERVRSMACIGITVSEFPVNIEAAGAARAAGIATVFGAPNILRGGSQSGSIKALAAVEQDLADCLCADYAPAALLAAIFKMPRLCRLSLPEAVALATRNPAHAVGLADRGSIAVGARADLACVRTVADYPQPCATWSAGRLVYQANYP